MATGDQTFELVQRLDDNINRLLAAVAFLALGGYALYTFSGSKRFGDLHLAPGGVSATDVFFFLFNLGIFFALAFAFAALDAGSAAWLRPRLDRETSSLRRGGPSRLGNAAAFFRRGSPPGLTDQAHDTALVRAKTLRLQRCRACIEFTMITMAMMGTARIPHFSDATKFWLIAVALALYGFGPALWRFTDSDPLATHLLYALNALVAAGFLFSATALGARWWAFGYALVWISASRLALPWARSTAICSVVWLSAGIGALVWFAH